MPSCKTCKSNAWCNHRRRGIVDCPSYVARIPLIHTDQTRPLLVRQSKSRVVSIGTTHMTKLLALAKSQAAYITKEDMCRQLIDVAHRNIPWIKAQKEVVLKPKSLKEEKDDQDRFLRTWDDVSIPDEHRIFHDKKTDTYRRGHKLFNPTPKQPPKAGSCGASARGE